MSETDGSEKSLKTKINDVLEIGGEGTASVIGSIMAESLVGQFLPGATSAVFSYKQKRHEKNMLEFVRLCEERHEEFAERLESMEKSQLEDFSQCLELVCDYVFDEPQEEKIEYMVNGLVGLSAHDKVKEDFVLHYYDALKELRLVDIDVLNEYFKLVPDINAVLEKHELSFDQGKSIKLKLSRTGLLKTKFDDQMEDLYENMINLQNFIEQLTKGKEQKLKRLNKLKKRDGFSISKFGREFVTFFLDEDDQTIDADNVDHLI